MVNTKFNKKKIAVLGPAGTFSDNASIMFIKGQKEDYEKVFFPTIDDAFHGINSDCAYSIIPIENTLDGYVQRTLDLLLEMDLKIISEIKVPVQFALISNTKNISDINKLYVQFKSNGQCRKFIDTLNNINIITTESNMESYYKIEEGNLGEAGIIPIHMIDESKAKFKIDNVTDSDDNYTRFIVIDNKIDNDILLDPNKKIRVPLYIIPSEDKPGILYEILGVFSRHDINLISIMSRPTKKSMGTYNFFIEVDADYSQKETLFTTISELEEKYQIKILGMYSA